MLFKKIKEVVLLRQPLFICGSTRVRTADPPDCKSGSSKPYLPIPLLSGKFNKHLNFFSAFP